MWVKKINGQIVGCANYCIDDFTFIDVTSEEWVNYRISTERSLLIGKIKSEAQKRIVVVYPDYKQQNINFAMTTILQKQLADDAYVLTEDETEAISLYNTCVSFIDNIRTKSNEIETTVNALVTLEEIIAFDCTEDSLWIN